MDKITLRQGARVVMKSWKEYLAGYRQMIMATAEASGAITRPR